MKQYPKIPRYDHPVITEDWFGSNTFTLEKYDGSCLRFCVYDERYDQKYDFTDLNGNSDSLNHGDILIGTKSNLFNPDSITKSKEFFKLQEKMEYLQKKISIESIFSLHSKYGSPLLFFAENMVRHTISYTKSTPPLIVFDIYKVTSQSTKREYGYDSTFNRFLPFSTVKSICNTYSLPYPRTIDTELNYEDISVQNIPQSEYGSDLDDGLAEGIVIRDDTTKRRAKFRSPEFKEYNEQIWGGTNISNTTKKIAYSFTTQSRVRKQLQNQNTPADLTKLVKSVIEDYWIEEYQEFHNKTFNPYQLYTYTAQRIKGILLRPQLFRLPYDTEKQAKQWNFDIPIKPTEPENPNEYLTTYILTEEPVDKYISQICEKSNKKYGNWIIEPLVEKLYDNMWINHRLYILSINSEISGSTCKNILYFKISQRI